MVIEIAGSRIMTAIAFRGVALLQIVFWEGIAIAVQVTASCSSILKGIGVFCQHRLEWALASG